MTPTGRLMRTLLLPSRLRATSNAVTNKPLTVAAANCNNPRTCLQNCRCFAEVKDIDPWNGDFWFSSNAASRQHNNPQDVSSDHKPPDERTIQLGKTVRLIHERLPTLLKEPLPSEILSPNISLHLFPSTHPHLPTVSGRIAYIAALWTAPVAWGRMPLIGNVQLVILSERMVRNGGTAVALDSREEKLIVKWKTCGKVTRGGDGTGGIYRGMGLQVAKDPVEKIKDFIAGTRDQTADDKRDAEEFQGIFIFEFDEKGRVAKHTIEHTEEGGHYDRMTRVVSVTDWLLGRFNGRGKEEEPALAFCEERPSCGPIQLVDRRFRR